MNIPLNPELEAGLISVCLAYPEVVPDVQMRVSAADFDSTVYRTCWANLQEALDEGKSIGLIELSDAVRFELDADDIDDWLGAISRLTPGREEATGIAERIRVLAQRRRLQMAASVVAQRAGDMGIGVEALLGELRALDREYETPADVEAPEDFGAALEAYIRESEDLLDRGEDLGVSTGLPFIDQRLRLRRGGLLLLGARQKVGKSWLVQEIAVGAAREGFQVGWFSSEMNYMDIGPRVLGSKGREPWVLDRPPANQNEIDRLRQAAAEFQGLPIRFRYESQADLILRRLNHWVRSWGLDVVVLDYFQDCRLPIEWGDKDHERQARFIVDLKRFAKTHGVLFIVVSSARKTSDDEHRALKVSDLYGSTRIPFTADWIVLMHRPSRKVQNLVEARMPEARLVRDQQRWFMLRNGVSLEYDEVSRSEAKRLIEGGPDPVPAREEPSGREAGGASLFDGVGESDQPQGEH